jgi:hypothetical protein
MILQKARAPIGAFFCAFAAVCRGLRTCCKGRSDEPLGLARRRKKSGPNPDVGSRDIDVDKIGPYAYGFANPRKRNE